MDDLIRSIFTGHTKLVVGVANAQSIVYGCAKPCRTAGVEVAVTWLNDEARPRVVTLAKELGASITGQLDVSVPGQFEAGSVTPYQKSQAVA